MRTDGCAAAPDRRDGYDYYAFISYSHRDARWASWLHRKLLFYRLPSVLRKEVGGDVRIRPICKDDATMPSAPLREVIEDSLRRSKHLIVVCSPNSAHPNEDGRNWVDEEVRYFASLGHADRIIPVIVDGRVGGGDCECFCPTLRELDILAVDVTKFSRRKALNFVAATLLGINPDKLEDCVARALRRCRAIWAAFLLPFMLLAAYAGIYAWDSTTPTYRYFADYVDSYGLPKGIFALSLESCKGRSSFYRFEYRGYRWGRTPHADVSGLSPFKWLGATRVLRGVVQCNGHGCACRRNHTELKYRPPVQEFYYARFDGAVDGRLNQIVYRDETGCFEKRLVLENGMSQGASAINEILNFRSENNARPLFARSLTSGETSTALFERVGGGIAQHLLKRDAEGRIVRKSYCNERGEAIADEAGIGAVEYVLDGFGRVRCATYVDKDGSRTIDGDGVGGKVYLYEGANLRRVKYVDQNGKVVNNADGWAVRTDDFDEKGNNVFSAYLDSDGVNTNFASGIAFISNVFDRVGDHVSERYLGWDGKPALSSAGEQGWRYAYDAFGREIRREAIGTNGMSCVTADGFVAVLSKYDEKGMILRRQYVDSAGRMTKVKDGISDQRFRNSDGRLVEVLSCSESGDPAPDSQGITRTVCAYYPGSHQARQIDVYADSGAGVWGSNGIYHAVRIFDDSRRIVQESYFDREDRPYPDENCVTLVKKSYWGADEILRTVELFDERSNSVWGVAGLYKVHRIYDEKGRQTEETYNNRGGGIATNADGVAALKYEYDKDVLSAGRKIALASEHGGIEGLTNVWRVVYDYDTNGNEVALSYYDKNGVPAGNGIGMTRKSMSYWEGSGVCKESDMFAEHGGLWGESNIFHGIQRYDRQGRVVEQVNLDRKGQPTPVASGEIRGVIEYHGESDTRKMLTDWRLGPTGDVHVCVTKYDETGRVISRVVTDGSGRPAHGGDGITKRESTYSEKGEEERHYYAETTMGVWGGCGIFHAVLHFDAKGRRTEQIHYDNRGELVADSHGNIRASIEYFDDSNLARRIFSHVTYTNVVGHVKCGIRELSYDELGRQTRDRILDEFKLPTAESGGVSVMDIAYWGDSNLVASKTYTAMQGGCLSGVPEFWRSHHTYEKRGYLETVRNFDKDNNPTSAHRGMYGFRVLSWDECGEVLRREVDGQKGKRIEFAIPAVRKIDKNGLLFRSGVRRNALVVRFDSWTFPGAWTMSGLCQSVRDSRERGKYVQLAEKGADGRYHLKSLTLPPGYVGVSFWRCLIPADEVSDIKKEMDSFWESAGEVPSREISSGNL